MAVQINENNRAMFLQLDKIIRKNDREGFNTQHGRWHAGNVIIIIIKSISLTISTYLPDHIVLGGLLFLTLKPLSIYSFVVLHVWQNLDFSDLASVLHVVYSGSDSIRIKPVSGGSRLQCINCGQATYSSCIILWQYSVHGLHSQCFIACKSQLLAVGASSLRR